MDICFYTMANDNRLEWARHLVSSGDVVDRPVWMFRIPPDHKDPKRYKIELLGSDLLPEADKYVYLDADSIMLKHGDWESDDCIGAKHEHWGNAGQYYKALRGEQARRMYIDLYNQSGRPLRMNSGLVVLSAGIRHEFAERWQYWNERIDSFSDHPERAKIRDQIGFAYVFEEFGLPALPERFCCLPKSEPFRDDHIMIHAAGKPSGAAIAPYTNAVNSLLGGSMKTLGNDRPNCRWQVLAHLLVHLAKDPARSKLAEIGVFKGETTKHMLNAFPGLQIYAVDNSQPMGAEKRHGDTEEVWEALCQEYGHRIINYRMDALDVELAEQMDGIFEDSDHRTEAVIAHAKHFWPMLKSGGFYAVHDIDYRGTYYSSNSVRKAMDILFPEGYNLGPDHTAWTVKQQGQTL